MFNFSIILINLTNIYILVKNYSYIHSFEFYFFDFRSHLCVLFAALIQFHKLNRNLKGIYNRFWHVAQSYRQREVQF